MRVPVSWLRDFVEIPLPVEELARRLTLAGLEVAKIEYIGRKPETSGKAPGPRHTWREDQGEAKANSLPAWEGIYVGELLEVRPHPNADRLVVALVDYGQAEPVQAVTGAPNVRIGDRGQKVAVAEAGTTLIDAYSEEQKWMKVKSAELRGVQSEVVLCSERELGISDDHTGVLILDRDAQVGRPLSELLGDVTLEFDLTPNLARCFSIIGVAREVAALTGQRFKTPGVEWHPTGPSVEGGVEVQIEDEDLCSRYSAALVKGVSIKNSPFWMRRRLALAGMRPIINIVDITNYVMLEWGQPLHAFDYRKLQGRNEGPPMVIVRRAKPGERITTLDEVQRELTEEMLLITDPSGPIAIAGVMGGLESEVTESTQDVLIESANFSNTNNRRTAQTLRLMSEASARFGRGIPAELTIPALKRAAQLIRELAGGEIAQRIVDAYPVKQERVEIDFDPGEVERLLGMGLTEAEIQETLERLEFECKPKDGKIMVRIPWHRLDVTRPADLVEEVARVVGYDRIPMTLMADPLPPQHRGRSLELERVVKDTLVGSGLTEVITYSLTSLEAAAKLDPTGRPAEPEGYLRVANPLSREREYLRRTLLGELLETAAENLKHRDRVALFEIGRVYFPMEGAKLRPEEPRRLGMVQSGSRCELSWHTTSEQMDLFDLKGVLEELLARLGIADYRFGELEHPILHPGRAAELLIQGQSVGMLGELHPAVRANFELPQGPVIVAVLNLERILKETAPLRQYQALPRFPAVSRDLAIIVDEDIPAERVARVIRGAGAAFLRDLVLFDLYQGSPIPEGKKSLAYRLRLQAPDRTLTDEEADALQAKIEERLAGELGAELRK